MTTPTEVKPNADFFVQNQDTVLADGNDGSTALKATRTANINPDIGNAQTIATVDGSLAAITIGTTDPLANTSGSASAKWSIAALMRWLISEVRRTGTIGATAANQTDATTTGSITAADSGSATATGAGGQSIITGSPSANSFVVATLSGHSTATLQITGTFVGTLVFERSVDGGQTWTPTSLVIAGVGSIVSSVTTIGLLRGNVAGNTNFRVRATAWTSGTATITIVAGRGVENVYVSAIGSYANAALQNETALAAAGSTTARGLVTAGYSKASYQVDVASIGTNVVIRVEGNNDNGSNWANLSGDQTITANGTYLYSFDGVAAGYVRLTLVSLSGGTPSVIGKLLRAN